jgi:hypothetical protein
VVEEMEKSSPHHTAIGIRSRTHHHVQNPQYSDVRCGQEAGCDRAEPLPLKRVSSEGRGRTAHRGRPKQLGSYNSGNYQPLNQSNVRPVGLAAAANVLEGPGRTLHLRKARRDWPQAAIPAGQPPGDRASAVPLRLPQMRPVGPGGEEEEEEDLTELLRLFYFHQRETTKSRFQSS